MRKILIIAISLCISFTAFAQKDTTVVVNSPAHFIEDKHINRAGKEITEYFVQLGEETFVSDKTSYKRWCTYKRFNIKNYILAAITDRKTKNTKVVIL